MCAASDDALGMVNAITRGLAESADRWGEQRGLPPLRWTGGLVRPILAGYSPGLGEGGAEAVRAAQQWADALGLVEQWQSGRFAGVCQWAGDLHGVTVEVWCISDREAFEAHQ
jgi:hypothetical protein